jgi:hypothetical protein
MINTNQKQKKLYHYFYSNLNSDEYQYVIMPMKTNHYFVLDYHQSHNEHGAEYSPIYITIR